MAQSSGGEGGSGWGYGATAGTVTPTSFPSSSGGGSSAAFGDFFASILNMGIPGLGSILQSILGIGTAAAASDMQQQSLDLQTTQAGLGNLQTLFGLQGTLRQIGVSQAETTSNIQTLTQYLGNFDANAAYQRNQYTTQGQAVLRDYQNRVGEQNVASAVRGFSENGGQSSATVMAQDAQTRLKEQTTLYEQGLTELNTNLNAQRDAANRQLGVFQTTLDTLGSAFQSTTDLIDQINGLIDPATGRPRGAGGAGPTSMAPGDPASYYYSWHPQGNGWSNQVASWLGLPPAGA